MKKTGFERQMIEIFSRHNETPYKTMRDGLFAVTDTARYRAMALYWYSKGILRVSDCHTDFYPHDYNHPGGRLRGKKRLQTYFELSFLPEEFEEVMAWVGRNLFELKDKPSFEREFDAAHIGAPGEGVGGYHWSKKGEDLRKAQQGTKRAARERLEQWRQKRKETSQVLNA